MNTVELTRQALFILAPEILLLLTATAMMTAGAFVKTPRHVWCAASVFASVLALGLLLIGGSASPSDNAFSLAVVNDRFAFYTRLILLLSSFALLAMAHDQVDDARAPEFFGALLFVVAGSMVVAAANELVILFVGLELVSIPTYLLLYLPRRNRTTLEAATKYFFLSIFSSGLLLFGMAYLYGLTGVSNLKAIAELSGRIPATPAQGLALLAVVFMMAGLGFRVAAVPFHFYAPDVYQGSPTVLAALLSWIPKAIGFAAMLRMVTPFISAAGVSEDLVRQSVLLAAIVAGVTMTLGNTVALAQNNLRRLLAYSSIAHAGYLMIGVAVAFNHRAGDTPVYLAGEGILFYLTAYALMTLGAFGVILLLGGPQGSVEEVDDLAGLSQTRPFWALALAFCLFSLAGIPPFLGFLGKYELFSAAFGSAGPGASILWWLAIVGVINSAIGAYYYLRLVVVMYLQTSKSKTAAPAPEAAWPTAAAVSICAILSLVLGLIPGPIVRATHLAAESALPGRIVADASPGAATRAIAVANPAADATPAPR